MKIGMLWYDNDPKTSLAKKISKAATYYQEKYARIPNLCYVHPATIGSLELTDAVIEVRISQSVMPNHIWMGVADQD